MMNNAEFQSRKIKKYLKKEYRKGAFLTLSSFFTTKLLQRFFLLYVSFLLELEGLGTLEILLVSNAIINIFILNQCVFKISY